MFLVPGLIFYNMSLDKHKRKFLDPAYLYGSMKNTPCFLLGNAPSLTDNNLNLLDNYFTVGINRILNIYDPTLLIWQDLALWQSEKNKILKSKCIKYARTGSESQGCFFGFLLKDREPRIAPDLKTLYGRGSSGSIAYQLVFALGCSPIILVGMDCTYGKDGKTDFYGKNDMHRPHTLPACNKGLEFIKNNAHDRILINCSGNRVFEKRYSLEEAIKMLPENSAGNREKFQKQLLGDNYKSIMEIMF